MTSRRPAEDHGPPTMTCAISLRDGAVSKPKLVSGSGESGDWTEADLEAALALAPALLELEGASPVTLRGGIGRRGGGREVSPDQMYFDSMGRLHVVEIKKGEAGLDAIAQVLAYGDMFRMLPPAAIEVAREVMRDTCQPQDLLRELREWAESKHEGKSKSKVPENAGPSPIDSGFPPGLSARHIVVAKSFSGAAKEFAEELTDRGTSLELFQAALRSDEDTVEIEITPFFRRPWIEDAWTAFGKVWPSLEVQAEMEFVGWGEPLLKKGMSLALKKDRRVRLVIEIREDGLWLCTTIPVVCMPKKADRTAAGASLRSLPAPKRSFDDGRWFYWPLEDPDPNTFADLAGRITLRLAEIFRTRT